MRSLAGRVGLTAGLLIPLTGLAAEDVIGVRNYSPFAQVFGLPRFADASVLNESGSTFDVRVTAVSHADAGLSSNEAIVVDGESYITSLEAAYGISDRFTLSAEIPFVAYNGGVFDGAIEWWHDLWGFPNGERDGPDNRLLINYLRDGVSEFLLDSASSGIGDVRIEARYRVAGTAAADDSVVLRAGIKLPSGDADYLRGSEATDYFVDAALRHKLDLPLGELILLGHAGVLVLGAGEVLPELQKETIGFGGLGAVWNLGERWRFNLQLAAQTSYFKSDLDELGSDSVSLTFGGSYTWVNQHLHLSVAMIEDLVTDITPDVALQVRLSKDLRL